MTAYWVNPTHLCVEKPYDGAVRVVPAEGTSPAGLALTWFYDATERLKKVRELLPKVYDGTHLVDCPYVDVLLRIREVLGDDV